MEARKLRKVKCTHLRCWNMQCETKKFERNIAKEDALASQMSHRGFIEVGLFVKACILKTSVCASSLQDWMRVLH
nr:hypothetical protein CFP56_42894 [Quercus suber]